MEEEKVEASIEELPFEVDLVKLTRAERLLILVANTVDDEENCGSGHNTEWAEHVDLVLLGRKGLIDYSDEELLEELNETFDEQLCRLIGVLDNVQLLNWARGISNIDSVDHEKRTWKGTSEDPAGVEEVGPASHISDEELFGPI